MSKYMEQVPIVILPLGEKDPTRLAAGDELLGRYVDCAKSDLVPDAPPRKGGKAYEIPNPESTIEELPIRTLKYSLNHIKETTDKEQSLSIGLEVILKALMMEINIASVQYDTKYNSKLEVENLQVYYYKEERVKRLLPCKEVFDAITSEFGNPPPSTTHIVSEVYYGVSMVADIRVETRTTTKMVNKTAAGMGKLIIGPISAGIEAALTAVLGNPADKVDVVITVTSTHGTFTDKMTVEEIFAEIKNLNTVAKGDMKPLKMFCVPIAQFLPDQEPPDNKVQIISDFFMQPLVQTMATLTDFQDDKEKDDDGKESMVPSSYFSKKVLNADDRLRMILKDPKNPITEAVTSKQKYWNDLAKELYNDGKSLTSGISQGTTTEENIQSFLSNYQTSFSIKECHEDINEFIRQGKKELSLINADDVDQFTEAKFVSSLSDLESEKRSLYRGREGAPVFLVELQTSQKEGEEIPNGLFLSAYNLSAKMDVFVMMPSTTETSFCLKLHKSGSPSSELLKVTDFKDIMIVLEILSVAFGASGGATAKWYQALASEYKTPIAFPRLNASYDDNVLLFIQSVIEEEKYKSVKIFPTFMSLKSHLMDTDFGSKIIMCLPVSSYVPLLEGIQVFKILLDITFKTKEAYEFIVGEFDLWTDDAPLLLVFQEGKLVASCLAWLDFLRLKQTIEESADGKLPDISQLSKTSSTFFPLRTEYHQQLYKLFQFSLYQKPTLVLHPYVLEIDAQVKVAVETALEICAAYLAIDNREQRMVTTLTHKLLELEPNYIKRFEMRGWSLVQKGFTDSNVFADDQRKVLRGLYLDLLFESGTELLATLGAFVHTLDFAIQAEKAKQTDPFLDLQKMITNKVLDNFKESGTELGRILAEHITLDNAEKAFDLVQDVVLQSEFVTPDKSIVPHLQSILSILPLPEADTPPIESPEYLRRITRWKETSEEAFHKILSTFINQVWSAPNAEIKEWLTDRLILKIVNELGRKRYPIWHQHLSNKFRDFTSFKEYDKLMEIIKGMKGIEGIDLEMLKQQHFIWSNPPFGEMIINSFKSSDDVDDDDKYMRIVFDAIQSEGGGKPGIPDYIVTSIAKHLRKFLFETEGGMVTSKLMKRRQMRIQNESSLN